MKRGRGRVYLGVVAAACCAGLGYAAAALAVANEKPPLSQQQVNQVRSHVEQAVGLEGAALKDISKHAPTAAESALRASETQLVDAEEILLPRDLADSNVLGDLKTAVTDDSKALGALIHLTPSRTGRWAVARMDVKLSIPRKDDAIGETAKLPVASTSSSSSTATSGLEACAGQATATQDFVKVSYPGLTGATGGISFAANGTTQAKTFALGSSGIGFASGFTAPTSGFATITVSLSTPSGPLSLNFTFPANSTPSSDCTLHK